MTVLAPQYKWIDGDGVAFGAPGLGPRWTSSAKDAVGDGVFGVESGMVHGLARHSK